MASEATLGFDGGSPLSGRPSIRLPWSPSPPVGQISPNKDMNFPRTTAALTLSPVPGGFRHPVLTHPVTEPSMRTIRPLPGAHPSGQPPAVQNRSRRFCLFVGSHRYGLLPCRPPFGPACSCSNSLPANLCARASFRHPLAGLSLPSASGYCRPPCGYYRYSHRGLAPHQIMPMSGVHNPFQRTRATKRLCVFKFCGVAWGAEPGRYASQASATLRW
jgi:hypothetical protein